MAVLLFLRGLEMVARAGRGEYTAVIYHDNVHPHINCYENITSKTYVLQNMMKFPKWIAGNGIPVLNLHTNSP